MYEVLIAKQLRNAKNKFIKYFFQPQMIDYCRILAHCAIFDLICLVGLPQFKLVFDFQFVFFDQETICFFLMRPFSSTSSNNFMLSLSSWKAFSAILDSSTVVDVGIIPLLGCYFLHILSSAYSFFYPHAHSLLFDFYNNSTLDYCTTFFFRFSIKKYTQSHHLHIHIFSMLCILKRREANRHEFRKRQ